MLERTVPGSMVNVEFQLVLVGRRMGSGLRLSILAGLEWWISKAHLHGRPLGSISEKNLAIVHVTQYAQPPRGTMALSLAWHEVCQLESWRATGSVVVDDNNFWDWPPPRCTIVDVM